MPIIEKHHVHPYSNAVLFHSGHRPDLPPGRQSRLTTSENGRVCLVFKSAFIHSLILQWRMTFRATVDCCPARRLRTILAAIVRSSAAGHRGTRPGGADLYKAGAPGWERGSLGSYRGALDLRWDRSASYWICPGVGGPARSRRGQCWTAGRVCTLFSFRNDPPEESRSPCVARARGELGDGVCFRTCSRRVRATGVNEPPRFFWRAFPLRSETRFIRRALCGRGHLCRRDGGRRE